MQSQLTEVSKAKLQTCTTETELLRCVELIRVMRISENFTILFSVTFAIFQQSTAPPEKIKLGLFSAHSSIARYLLKKVDHDLVLFTSTYKPTAKQL